MGKVSISCWLYMPWICYRVKNHTDVFLRVISIICIPSIVRNILRFLKSANAYVDQAGRLPCSLPKRVVEVALQRKYHDNILHYFSKAVMMSSSNILTVDKLDESVTGMNISTSKPISINNPTSELKVQNACFINSM